VLLIGVIVYFLCVSAALAWWLLPGLRERLTAHVGDRVQRARARQLARRAAISPRAHPEPATGHSLSEWASDAGAVLRAHRKTAAVAAAAVLAVPLLAVLARQWWVPDAYDHTQSRIVNPQVAALLAGEQLVPPAPLPPELFLTREVIQARPLVGSANRQWELLDPEFRQRLLGAFKLMREQHGLEMVLIEGYRSPERQTELAGLGPNVTHAAAGESWHQYGLAADCAFLINGRVVVSELNPIAMRGYALYGDVAQSFGLTWGGSWRRIKDLGHVELRRPGTMKKL
jgi:peptidoglycan LD-endopeptidase CwlK